MELHRPLCSTSQGDYNLTCFNRYSTPRLELSSKGLVFRLDGLWFIVEGVGFKGFRGLRFRRLRLGA